MNTVVCKFGGTSVANAAQIAKVASIVRSVAERRIVVVSAPGKRTSADEKITDILIDCHARAARGESVAERYRPIRERFLELAEELEIGHDLDPWIDEVERDIAAGASRSAVVSRGEYLSAHMIARYLGYEFVDAAECIVFADERTVDLEATIAKTAERLDAEGRYVIPGFYGARRDGAVQIFSRGGSDISAALVARAVGAQRYENWTDVSGLLAADPRIVDAPAPIARISYRGLRELAYLGAAVFHDEAVAPVAEAGIPIQIRNTNEPDHPGTMIVASDGESLAFFGVAGKRGYRKVSVRRSMLSTDRSFDGAVRRFFEERGLEVRYVAVGGDSAAVVVSDLVDDTASMGTALREAFSLDEVAVSESLALVGACRLGIAGDAAMTAEILSRLNETGIEPQFFIAGYSPDSVLVAVAGEAYETAVRAVSEVFR